MFACRVDNPAFNRHLHEEELLRETDTEGTDAGDTDTGDTDAGDTDAGDTKIETSDDDSSSSTTSSTSTPDPDSTWPVDSPKPSSDQHPDHCDRGAKLCFILGQADKSKVESAAQEPPRYSLKINNQAIATTSAGLASPLNRALYLGPTTEVISDPAHPFFAGQDLGVELLFSTQELNLSSPPSSPISLLTIGSRLELELMQGSTLVCRFDTSATERYIERKATISPTDKHVVAAACFLYQGRLYLWTSGSFDSASKGAVAQDVVPGSEKLRLGRPVDSTLDSFVGKMYMLRVWNNIPWMRASILLEAPNWGMDTAQFPELSALPNGN